MTGPAGSAPAGAAFDGRRLRRRVLRVFSMIRFSVSCSVEAGERAALYVMLRVAVPEVEPQPVGRPSFADTLATTGMPGTDAKDHLRHRGDSGAGEQRPPRCDASSHPSIRGVTDGEVDRSPCS